VDYLFYPGLSSTEHAGFCFLSVWSLEPSRHAQFDGFVTRWTRPDPGGA